MISILISWIPLALTAYLWGLGIMKIAKVSEETKAKHLDMIMFMGLCSMTVYAQYFSLVMGVGLSALVIVAIIDVIMIAINLESIKEQLKALRLVKWYTYVIIAIISIVLVILSSRRPLHYDTGLYHAQAVRWIEEYGVVPGLGNLHNRLAYNSAIFALEALFGLKPILHQTIHGVDGFFEVVLISYTLLSFKGIRQGKIQVSDALRVGLLLYLTIPENIVVISSLGSDIPALGLMMYILIKWVSLIEDKESEDTIRLQSLLCVLAVYGMSIKLSVAMMILLTIHPVVEYIKTKDFKNIIKYLVLGTIVIAPFLIRNVIISGYLIYPYPEIDLFNVDWKMNAYTCLFDRYEIQAWGRKLCDVNLANASFGEWFPVWWSNLSLLMKIWFITTPVSIVVIAVQAVYRIIKDKKTDILSCVIAIIASVSLWFTGSPDSRYGGVFLSIAPLLVIGFIVTFVIEKVKESKTRTITVTALSVILAVGILLPFGKYLIKGDNSNILRCADYEWKSGELVELDGQMMFVPTDTDQAGYNLFPSTPYMDRVALIELRGDTFHDGIRLREEYKDKYVSTYGGVGTVNIFEKDN